MSDLLVRLRSAVAHRQRPLRLLHHADAHHGLLSKGTGAHAAPIFACISLTRVRAC